MFPLSLFLLLALTASFGCLLWAICNVALAADPWQSRVRIRHVGRALFWLVIAIALAVVALQLARAIQPQIG